MDSMWVDDDNIYRNVWSSDDVIPSDMELEEPINIEFLNSKNGANNAYWLFTRENPTHPQLIINGDVSTIRNSNYVANRPLMVVVHGWSGSVNSVLNTRITAAFLATTDVNVIVVDWQELAAANYVTAVAGVPSVGQHLGEFVNWLIENGGGVWDNVHLVGFSLGAHIVGNAGRTLDGRARRVTGLDPAGPLWHALLSSNALRATDGQYVEAIHTNVAAMGILNPIGDTDFYPNAGWHQPGCEDINQCSHSRAHALYASSILTDHFVGRRCINLTQALNNLCTGAALNMGNGNLNKTGYGIYGLSTSSVWPY
ncbi:pancreatic lipase-related protein 2-like [Leptidea sinapis]|uniref:pancreatic lipase-related protein 2-like n=1 Tax=Leptidea sinapis TaxID=189913 RepID=UPI0021C29949|nr:pancreatic lipase-related protein 2-like [Leptidea sinapis]